MRNWLGRGSHDDELVIATTGGVPVARVPEAARAQLRYLVARLDLHDGGIPASIALTSPDSGEGVTFVAHALAAVLSEDFGRRTCLVSANWWGDDDELSDANPGLGGVLRSGVGIDDALIETRYERLSLIPCGALPDPERTMLATTERMRVVLDALQERFDNVVVDLPAISVSTCAMALAAATEASLLVVRQRLSRVDQVESAVADLRHTRMLGVVLNDNYMAMPTALQRWLIDA